MAQRVRRLERRDIDTRRGGFRVSRQNPRLSMRVTRSIGIDAENLDAGLRLGLAQNGDLDFDRRGHDERAQPDDLAQGSIQTGGEDRTAHQLQIDHARQRRRACDDVIAQEEGVRLQADAETARRYLLQSQRIVTVRGRGALGGRARSSPAARSACAGRDRSAARRAWGVRP